MEYINLKKSNWKIKVHGKGTPVNDIVEKFWASRGIDNPEAFLFPVGNILPSTSLTNIIRAAEVFYSNIVNKSKFLIYADVDADGCSSAAILYHYITKHECECEVYINKKKEHGVKKEFLETDHQENIVIVVDSINEIDPDLVIIDSIQTFTMEGYLPARAGSPTQTMECANELLRVAKNEKRQRAVIIVGQMTKADELAGLTDGKVSLGNFLHGLLQLGLNKYTTVAAEIAILIGVVLKVSIKIHIVKLHNIFLQNTKNP